MRVEGHFGVSSHVLVNRVPLTPERSLQVRNHSPTGFNWGYAGSGPAQLALALLLEAGLSEGEALDLYQAFKFDVIARQPQNDLLLEIDVKAWAVGQLAARHAAERSQR